MKISKQWKKGLEISFYTSVPKIMICYTVPEIWHVSDVIVIFHLGQFLFLLSRLQPQKWKFHKNEKKPWRYQHLPQVYQKLWSYALFSWYMTPDRCNCQFSFWAIFCHFTSLTAWKIKISKKWKKQLEIS